MYILIKKLNVKICIFETLTDEVTNSNFKKCYLLIFFILWVTGQPDRSITIGDCRKPRLLSEYS